MPATTKAARTRRSPDNGFASVGAVRQSGGSLPIYICNTCGREVVWCESKRTGRKYLANVRSGHLGQRYYIAANVHGDCAGLVEQEAAYAARHDANQAALGALLADLRSMRKQVEAGEMTEDAYAAATVTRTAEYEATIRLAR